MMLLLNISIILQIIIYLYLNICHLLYILANKVFVNISCKRQTS